MKEVWSKRAAVNLIDSHKEYLQDLPRIAAPSFRPTTQDILRAHVKTTQVVMERFRIDGTEFEMYNVLGSQRRSERRKWINCFDNVDSIIFVAALSDFDQTNNKGTNRMSEALELFRSVCNNRAFANASIVLLLNKKDIFYEKIMHTHIAAQQPFSDYTGPPRDFDSGVLYFVEKFKECLDDNDEDDLHDSCIHVTCATDMNNMEFLC